MRPLAIAGLIILEALSDAAGIAQTVRTPVDEPYLARRVTVHRSDAALPDLLASASAATGVTMRAADDIARLRVSVFVRNVPLSSFQTCLAEALHLQWNVVDFGNHTNPPIYILYRSREQAALEQKLADQGETSFRHALADMRLAAALAPERRRDFLNDRPRLSAMFSDPRGAAIGSALNKLPPDETQRLLDGGEVPARISDPDQLAALRAAHGSAGVDSHGLTFSLVRRGTGANTGIALAYRSPWGEYGFSVFQPASALEAYPDLAPDHEGPDYAAAKHSILISKAITGRTFDALLEKLSDAAGVNIIAECYSRHRGAAAQTVPAGATTLEGIFDSFILGDQVWWKRGPTFMIQRKFWFLDRLGQIPADTLARIKAIVKKGAHGLEIWSELGRLSPRQWMTLQDLGLGEYDQLLDHYPLAAFFSHLSAASRGTLLSSKGLGAASLPRADQERLRTWIIRSGPPEAEDVARAARSVRVTAEVVERHTVFRAMAVADGRDPIPLCEQSLSGVPHPPEDEDTAVGGRR